MLGVIDGRQNIVMSTLDNYFVQSMAHSIFNEVFRLEERHLVKRMYIFDSEKL